MGFNPAPKPEKREKKAKKRIPPKSDKKIEEDEAYAPLAAWFKTQNRKCEVCNVRATDDIHHKAGRISHWDKWAEWFGITLLMDIRHWLCVCRECHNKIEESPEWAKENNYSLNRIK